MHPNPFSPSFAMLPGSFFGRKAYLQKYAKALDSPGSAYRFFILTGTRGCGKTSLISQYELLATERRWDVIRATSIDALALLCCYAGIGDGKSKNPKRDSAAPHTENSAFAGDDSLSDSAYDQLDLLSTMLIKKLRILKANRGLAIIIDEAQKLGREDIARIATAVQDAKLEGLNVSLVLCGRPSAYRKLRSCKDCAFIRLMKHEKLWTMPKGETMSCLEAMFGKVPEIELTRAQLREIGRFSGGHPYLIQLIGDHLYRLAEDGLYSVSGVPAAVPDGMIELAESASLAEYKKNVLDDVLTGTHSGTRRYIEEAFRLRDERGYVRVSEINAQFGKDAQQMSPQRANALNTQILKVADRGRLKFALPHYNYIFEPFVHEPPETSDDEWDF